MSHNQHQASIEHEQSLEHQVSLLESQYSAESQHSISRQQTIDENLQSRQLAVYSREAMHQMRNAHVLISGLNGLGCEIAKNVILSNVGRVTLHDDQTVTAEDLGSNFYVQSSDIGKNRALACLPHLKELNPAVHTHAIHGQLLSLVAHPHATFNIIVLVDVPQDVAIRVDLLCRARQPAVKFLYTNVRGLFGYAFSDFGPEFIVQDSTGETLKTAIVESISNGNPARVQCVAEQEIDLDDGDFVTFSEIQGMTELNNTAPIQITNVSKGRKCFDIGDTTSFGKHIIGGIVHEKREPKIFPFRSLTEALIDPGNLVDIDGSKAAPSLITFEEPVLAYLGTPEAVKKFGRSGLLHLVNRALSEFQLSHLGHLPDHTNKDADEVVRLAIEINNQSDPNNKVEELTEGRLNDIRAIAKGARSVLNPMAAIFGGIVGQEVVKASTGKYTPIHQWLYFDAIECLTPDLAPAEFEVHGSRYDNQIRVFGKSFQDKLAALNVFLVGCGALGCEYAKNLALMGVATSTGMLTVTDDDIIEKSNLSRQFLFRNHNVGHSKSESGSQAVKTMNPNLHVTAMRDRVSTDTESVFNDSFWTGLDFVVNALDNVKARLYVDERCVAFSKPLFEAGTLGTKCNVQVILPFKTENYGATADPPEKEAPQCAIHNFPHNIDHCLGLARSEFVGNFDSLPADTNEFIASGPSVIEEWKSSGENINVILDKLIGDIKVNCGMDGGMKDILVSNKPTSFESCVAWARLKFESYFVNRIKQLTFNFPADFKTTKGLPFWSPPKRFPVVVSFNAEDPMHMQFIIAASNLRAKIGRVEVPTNNRDPEYFKAILVKVVVPEFIPKSDASIKTDDEAEDAARREAAEPDQSPEEKLPAAIELIQKAVAELPQGFELGVEEFEKDDDKNHHMDFIAAFGNLRARNYGIPEVDTLHAKLKAGRIIPAIATSTALATGLACLEIYKHLSNKPLSAFRNAFINTGINLLSVSEPIPAKRFTSRTETVVPDPINHPEYEEEEEIVAYPEGHTVWDSIVVEGAAKLTLQELIDWFKANHNIILKIWSVPVGKALVSLLHPAIPATKRNLSVNIAELLETRANVSLKGRQWFPLEANFATTKGDTVETSRIVLKL